MRIIRFLFILVLFVVAALPSYAQEISAKASAPKYDFLVGDRINVLLEVRRPASFSVNWEKEEPTPGQPELADTITTDSVENSGFVTIKIHLPLAAFDSGNVTYPAQTFVFHKAGDANPITLKTEPLVFHVSTISVDLKKEIKPIVEPVEPGLDVVKFIWQMLIFLVLLGLVIFFIVRWTRNRKKEKQLFAQQAATPRPPWELARQKLSELKKKDLTGKGQVKAYYISLSNIIRQYIADIFEIDALELTTEELIDSVSHRSLTPEAMQKLSHILELSDSVKFAKYVPVATDHEQSMADAEGLVYETSPGK